MTCWQYLTFRAGHQSRLIDRSSHRSSMSMAHICQPDSNHMHVCWERNGEMKSFSLFLQHYMFYVTSIKWHKTWSAAETMKNRIIQLSDHGFSNFSMWKSWKQHGTLFLNQISQFTFYATIIPMDKQTHAHKYVKTTNDVKIDRPQ